MSLSKSGNTKKDAWLRLLSKEKVYPECSKLESGTDATEGKIAEAKHIRRLKSLGEPLTNYQHAGSSLNSYYIRFPDDLESQVEEEKRRVEDSSGVETKMVNVIASLVKRGLTSLARSRKRKGGKS